MQHSRSCVATAAIALTALLSMAAPGADERWIPVLVGPEELARADSADARIRAVDSVRAPQGTPWVAVLRGTAPIVVTAPHATSPLRKGKPRFPDKGTGTLAIMLNQVAGATVVYTTYASPCDGNDTDSCAFKDTLASVIARVRPVLVLDLHSSSPARPYDVDFGTVKGASIKANPRVLSELSSVLAAHGLTCQSRDFFAAGEDGTIARFVAARGTPCMQLEINAVWLRPQGPDESRHRFAQVLNALTAFVRSTGARGKSPAIP